MADFEVTSPQGQKFIVSAPEGASQEQILAYAQGQFQKGPKDYKALQTVENYNPTDEMSTLEKFNAGMGKAFYDIGQGAAQLVGFGESSSELEDRRALDAPLMKTGAGMAGNIAGNIAVLAPAAVIPGANTVAGAGTIGAITAALQPVGSAIDRMKNMGLGFFLGSGTQFVMQNPVRVYEGAKTLISAPFKAAKAAVEPLYPSGQEKIVSRALNRATGPNNTAAIRNLESAGELVPGSVPTAGESSGSAGIASLQRAAAAVTPEEYAARAATNNLARVTALEEMAGTGGQREFYDVARKQAANDLYKQAYQKGIDITRDPATGHFRSKAEIAGIKGEITKLLKRPAIQDAMNGARTLAANEGVNLSNPAGSVQGLDYVKRALDDQIASATPGSNQARVLTDLKNRLLTTLDRLSPDYAQARVTFAEMSKPINQMDIAQEIAEKSVNKLTGNVQPQAFARALQDRTAQTATGFNRATLQNTMTPEQLAMLENIKADLARSVAAQNLGRGAGSDTVQKLAMTNLMQQSGLPLGVIRTPGIGRVANWLYERADEEMAQKLAQSLLSPRETARLMKLTPTQLRAQEPSQLLRDRMSLLGRAVVPAGLLSYQE